MGWIALVLIVFAVAVSLLIEQAKYAQIEPMSDDEFLAALGPEIPRDVALKVRRTISDATGVPYEKVYPDHKILDC